mmetsp:Transcript_9061/g.15309  ORF Transcript_9061/g.15309 Transcript_9061/m.15309 type:complete len:95 (+) Transcript_9061:491-775(+)
MIKTQLGSILNKYAEERQPFEAIGGSTNQDRGALSEFELCKRSLLDHSDPVLFNKVKICKVEQVSPSSNLCEDILDKADFAQSDIVAVSKPCTR